MRVRTIELYRDSAFISVDEHILTKSELQIEVFLNLLNNFSEMDSSAVSTEILRDVMLGLLREQGLIL